LSSWCLLLAALDPSSILLAVSHLLYFSSYSPFYILSILLFHLLLSLLTSLALCSLSNDIWSSVVYAIT